MSRRRLMWVSTVLVSGEVPQPRRRGADPRGNHLAGVLQRRGQKLELAGVRVDLAVVAAGGVGVLVQRDARAVMELLAPGTRRPGRGAQKARTRRSTRARRRAWPIVVSPPIFQADDFVQLRCRGRKGNSTGPWFERSRRHSRSRPCRQHNIQDKQIIGLLGLANAKASSWVSTTSVS